MYIPRGKFFIFFILLHIITGYLYSNEEHAMKPGETIYQLSKEYGIPVDVLLQENHISNPSAIPTGKTLQIPDKYKVKRGDTLYSIAHQHGMTLYELRALNKNISDNISVGQEIVIRRENNNTRNNGSIILADQSKNNSEHDITKKVVNKSNSTSSSDLSFGLLNNSDLINNSRAIGKVSNNWPVSGNGYILKGKLPGMLIEGVENSLVKATSSGVVIYASLHTSFSNVVVIQGDDDLVYVYAGQNKLYVKQGDRVTKGSVLGSLGVMPTLQKPFLYFSLWDQDKAVDPRKLING